MRCLSFIMPPPPRSTLFPYTTLFRSNCEVVQFFVKNNMQWFGKPHAPADLAQYASELNQCGFACVFGHTGYLINLGAAASDRSEEHTSELQSQSNLVCRLLLEKKKSS